MLLLFRYQVTLVTWQGIRLPLRESLQGNWCLTHSTKAWGGVGLWAEGGQSFTAVSQLSLI